MTEAEHPTRAARARRRAERRAERERERQAEVLAKLVPGGVSLEPSPGSTIITVPQQELLRRRTFKLLERCHSEIVCCREGIALALFGADPDSDEHGSLRELFDALNDEIDDLRELCDELLRRITSLALTNADIVHVEKKLASAQAIANPTDRVRGLIAASTKLLSLVDDTLDDASA